METRRMEALDVILTRRSVRHFLPTPVENEKITQILRAGFAAPSAGNQQPWQFIVVSERAQLDAIMGVHPYATMLKTAPCAILVCGDLRRERHAGFWVQDCAAAVENMLLAIHALRLGSVWLGIYPRQERVDGFAKLFNVPEQVVPFAVLPVGYPEKTQPPSDRLDKDRIHNGVWGHPLLGQ